MDEKQPPLHIRRGMDVYDSYQQHYLGEVVHVWRSTLALTTEERNAGVRQTGSDPEIPQTNPSLRQEQGHVESPTRLIGHKMLGEEQGPRPTMDVGNTGPVNQSADHEYATVAHDPEAGVVMFAVRPGRYNPLARRFYIPSSAVHSVSMERIVVDVEGKSIPDAWRTPPTSDGGAG